MRSPGLFLHLFTAYCSSCHQRQSFFQALKNEYPQQISQEVYFYTDHLNVRVLSTLSISLRWSIFIDDKKTVQRTVGIESLCTHDVVRALPNDIIESLPSVFSKLEQSSTPQHA